MALQYSPKIVQDGLVMCLDPSLNKSYPTTDLPIKDGLNLWLDAADDTTFSYSSGTTVSQWRDKSGQNNHAIVMGGSPSRSVAINSRKAVSFTSTTSFKCLTGVFSSTATHIVVCRATTSSATYQRVYNGGANSDYRVFIGGSANNIATFWGSGPSVWFDTSANSPSTTLLNTLRIISAVNNGTTATPYYDGTSMSTKTTTNSAAYTGYELNTYGNGVTNQTLTGEVCEIIVFNKQLSTTELKQVHTYLGQKWGVLNTDRSIIDLSGNDDNGLLGNGTTANMPVYSYYNKGTFKFDGSNDYINCGNANALNFGSGDFSVETWFTRDSNATTNLRLLSKGADSDVSGSAGFAFFGSDSGANFAVNPSGTRTIITAASYSVGEWVHLVGVVQRGSTMRTYKNAVLTNSATAPAGSVSSASNNLNIGRSSESSSLYWAGNIAIVRIYNKALSLAEISQNYEAQKSKFANTIVQQGLVLNLDAGNPYSYAGAGTTWYDVSGNNNDLTIAGSPTYSLTQGWTFTNGSTANYMIKNPITFPTTTISVEVWCKTSGPGSTAIFSYASSVADNDFLIFDPSNVSLYTASGAVASGINITDGNWKQIVRTSNRSTGAEVLYVNGVSQFTTTLSAGTLVTTGGSLVLAQEQDSIGGGFDPNQAFGGNITIVRVYNRILTATEVLQNYNDTKGRFGL